MSLQRRILALFLALLLVVLGVTLFTVSRATYRHTLERAEEELVYARRILFDTLRNRERALREAASALAKDDALRQAIFADVKDRESVLVALNNHRLRTTADLSFLVQLDGTILADTADPRRQGRPFPFPELLREEANPSASLHPVVLDGAAYQLIAVPYYVPVSAPEPSLWLLLGRAIDDPLARELRGLIGIEVSVVQAKSSPHEQVVLASSLPTLERRSLETIGLPASAAVEILPLAGEDYLALAAPFPGAAPRQPLAGLLLRPSAAALLDFRKLSGRFIGIALASGLLAITGAYFVARGVTRPIRGLEEAARRITAGDYAAELPRTGAVELRALATEFESMQRAVREREEAIQHLAFHDDLTGLPNRNHFQRALTGAIATAGRDHRRLAVVVVDLDRFREINDALGHHVGDHLLLEVAERLRAVAAEQGVEIARLGGDEFALLLPAAGMAEARETMDEIRGALSQAKEVDDLRIDLAASLGIAIYPDHGGDAGTLLKQAEVAMYVAKERRLGAVFYDSSQDRHSVERLSLVSDLRQALKSDALHLCYQPKLDLLTGHADEAEVLLRWRHPRLGDVNPGEFIPIAEQTGLIREITVWVLRHALEQAAQWRREGLQITLAINLSALDLHDPRLPERLQELLKKGGVPAERLILEITESSVMAEPDTARRLLDEVTELGVRVSIDDFGTGYSSLAQLKRLPVQELKVDKSFVMEMTRSRDVSQIVRSTIELGHNLGLRVVGEGVESAATLDALRVMGCDLAQGYFVSPPLPATEFARWFASQRPVAARLA